MTITGEQVAILVSVATAAAAIGTALVLAVSSRFRATQGERGVAVAEHEMVIAERSQANEDAETTLGLLREQIVILRSHRDEREAEIKTEREEWRSRESKMERRIESVEAEVKASRRDYTNLVLTVTTMGLCAEAPTCKSYNPGDRRVLVNPADSK